jgi:hypothetical protein
MVTNENIIYLFYTMTRERDLWTTSVTVTLHLEHRYRLWALGSSVFLERDGLSHSRHTVGRLLWAEFQRLVAGLREVNPSWDTRRLEQVKGQAFKNFHT